MIWFRCTYPCRVSQGYRNTYRLCVSGFACRMITIEFHLARLPQCQIWHGVWMPLLQSPSASSSRSPTPIITNKLKSNGVKHIDPQNEHIQRFYIYTNTWRVNRRTQMNSTYIHSQRNQKTKNVTKTCFFSSSDLTDESASTSIGT